MIAPMTRAVWLLVVVLLAGVPAAAEPIFPAGANPALDAQLRRHGRQFYELNARPFGLSLDVWYASADARALIEQFLAQDQSDDFVAVTGQHPFTIIREYGEHGDLGFFGGNALAATAYEYLTLKREGAPAADLARARARVVRAAESWHVFYVVTGGGGVVARGIRRLVPEDASDPPIPDSPPTLVPLFDESGAPLPQPKDNGSERADNSGGVLPAGVWTWIDSCSKDQLVGQVFGMVALYDAMKDDPDIDQALVRRLQADAKLVGEMLMTVRDITQLEGPNGEGSYDLIIMDADGRPTKFHDLNPKSLEKWYFPAESSQFNRFNVIMALGIIKGLLHVAGDPALEAYLYQELMGTRQYLDLLSRTEGAVDYIYNGANTNWDDPDMTADALWLAVYLETDPEVLAPLRAFLEERWWAPAGEPFAAVHAKQPWWHLIYLTLTDRGVDAALRDEARDLLEGFSLGPYFNDPRENCDAAELAARECVALDGVTVLHLIEGPEGQLMADEALHPSIRPPSNYDSRSNPFAVNGGGGDLLNPGGDLLAAYWVGRYMEASAAGQSNRSPFAATHMPIGGWPPDEPGADGGGCGCAAAGTGAAAGAVWLVLLLAAAAATRRCCSSSSSSSASTRCCSRST
jgi:MYXO-CTERM domain-containing protein